MAIVRVIRARRNDTLCGIAVDNGFKDCRKVRDANPGAEFVTTRPLRAGDVVNVPEVTPKVETGQTEMRHRFRRPGRPIASIRFIRDIAAADPAGDPIQRVLNVSNYVTNTAGADGTAAFPGPGHHDTDPNAREDEDAFKLEVHDLRTGRAQFDVRLEALRPTYNAAGRLEGHTEFPGTADPPAGERGRRSLTATARQIAGSRRFRTPYLRLVVDDVDDQVAPHQPQTLLVTDMVDAGDAQVEILDQNLRAEYEIDTCPAAPRCRVSAESAVDRGRTVDLVVRVCRAVASGAVETVVGGPNDDGIIPLADIKRRIETFCRRCWAQAHIRFRITRLETVDLPSNMLTVGDATGNRARGTRAGSAAAGQIGFTVNVQRFGGAANSSHVVAPFNVPAGNTPEQTAGLIAARINALPGLTATVSRNAPEHGVPDDSPSADVLITVAGGGRATITNLTPLANQDADQKVARVNLTLTVRFRNSRDNYHVGGPEQRNLVKALDTGDQVIDIQVVDVVPGTRGFTVPELANLNANRQPVSGVRNSIIMPRNSSEDPNNPSSPPNNNPFSLPHEIGHILTDNGLHSTAATELMRSGTSGQSTTVTDSKRIIGRLPAADNWEVMTQSADGSVDMSGHDRINAVDRVRRVSDDLLN